MNKPPRLAVKIFQRLFPDSGYLTSLGDLQEAYQLIRTEHSALWAHLWYWMQLIQSIPFWFGWQLQLAGNRFLSMYRNLKSNKIFTLIHISGLVLTFCSVLAIIVWVAKERSFDRFHENYPQIYRVITIQEDQSGIKREPAVVAPLAPLLKETIPEIQEAVRIFEMDNWIMSTQTVTIPEHRVGLVDASFLSMFTFPWITGDEKMALVDPYSVIISSKIASQYFNEIDPVGQTLSINSEFDLKITGVIDFPENSHIQFDFVTSFELISLLGFPFDNWQWPAHRTYLLLRENASVQAVNRKIETIMADHVNDSPVRLSLQPLNEIHLHSSDFVWDLLNHQKGNILSVDIFSLLAAIILIIASINIMNLSGTRVSTRMKELGIRKLHGETRSSLIRQMVWEGLFVTLIALGMALILLIPLYPKIQQLSGGTSLFIGVQTFPVTIILIILAIISIVSALTMGYSALILSDMPVMTLLASRFRHRPGGKNKRHAALLFLQFLITSVLIASTLIVHRQIRYLQTRDLGLNPSNLLWIETPPRFGNNRYAPFKDALLKHSGIETVTRSMVNPLRMETWRTTDILWPGKSAEDEISVLPNFVDYDFFKCMRMPLVQGRTFDQAFGTDETASFILNEKSVHAMQLKKPVGATIRVDGREGRVVGVVGDFHQNSLRHAISPVIFKLGGGSHLFIRFKNRINQDLIAYIEREWSRVIPGHPFSFRLFDEMFSEHYQADLQFYTLFTLFSGLALALSLLGLFGITAFNMQMRKKEMGIRKVLGASFNRLMTSFASEYLLNVVVANVLAIPCTMVAMRQWLQHFAYRTDLRINPFLVSLIITVSLALTTVTTIVWNSERRRTVDSLRYE